MENLAPISTSVSFRTFVMKMLIASTPTDLTYVPASKDLMEMDPRVLILMNVKPQTHAMETQTASTPTDLTGVLADRDSLGMVPLVLTSTSAPRMEVLVGKTQIVSTKMDRTLVFAEMATPEMAQLVLVTGQRWE